jgi:hypothetical protein
MEQLKKSVKDAMVNVDHVEETSEGLLKGGFAIIGGNEGEPSPQFDLNFGNCHNCVAGCGGPTSKSKGNGVIDMPSLSF